jgi:hypothetical protein
MPWFSGQHVDVLRHHHIPITFVISTGAMATYAAFRKERRMKLDDATNLDRKSGGAQWRDRSCL